MTAPVEYKGNDAVRLVCLKDYTVQGGTGPGENGDTHYIAGKNYSCAPMTAAHLLRKVYALRVKADDGRMVYAGDAPHFEDPKAAKEMAEDEAENLPIEKMTVKQLDAFAAGLDGLPDDFDSMKKAEKIEAIKAAQ